MNVLENVVLPMYYDEPERWLGIVNKAAGDIIQAFDSDRMAREYYARLYDPSGN